MAEENYMNQGPAVSPEGHVQREQTGEQQNGGGPLGGEADAGGGISKGTKTVSRTTSENRPVWEEARAGIQTLRENTDQYVRNNPARAVFTALAVGFVLGLMRRH